MESEAMLCDERFVGNIFQKNILKNNAGNFAWDIEYLVSLNMITIDIFFILKS